MSICDKNIIKEESSKDKDKHCDYNNFKRARYFHGMLMTDRDFKEEQSYHNEKRKLLTKMLHGWGVVCGLGIKATKPVSSKIIITPGMALDCEGNEILVCEDFEVNLKQEDICPDKSDPCPKKEMDCKYYIAIKYNEASTDTVPVYATGGGCEEKVCNYSRTREGFCVKLLKELPCYNVLPKKGVIEEVTEYIRANEDSKIKSERITDIKSKRITDKLKYLCETIYPCPECCCKEEPYVVLGSIKFTNTDCTITIINQEMISIREGRKYVITPMFWQYYLASLYPPIATVLDNPFTLLCRLLPGMVSQEEMKTRTAPQMAEPFAILAPRITADDIEKITAVGDMTQEDAEAFLDRQKIKINKTITLSPEHVPDIVRRALAFEKTKSKMVDLVIDDKTGKVLFYVPAKVPAKDDYEDITGRLKKSEEMIKNLGKTIDNLNKKIDELGNK